MENEIIKNENQKEITPSEYFETLKGKKVETNSEELNKFYDVCMRLVNKYKITNQKRALKRLIFYIECIERERKAIESGFTTYIQKDDVVEYIDDVASNVVKIIELERFERDIPDEVVEKIQQANGIFDEMYVIYTDYTGKDEKKVAKERQERDPILFGVFINRDGHVINNRFYFIADWIDEYCDLTLDKMISEMKSNSKDMKAYDLVTPEEYKDIIKDIDPQNKLSFVTRSKMDKWVDMSSLIESHDSSES